LKKLVFEEQVELQELYINGKLEEIDSQGFGMVWRKLLKNPKTNRYFLYSYNQADSLGIRKDFLELENSDEVDGWRLIQVDHKP